MRLERLLRVRTIKRQVNLLLSFFYYVLIDTNINIFKSLNLLLVK